MYVNNPLYKDRGPTTSKSGETITIMTQTCKMIKNSISNIYIMTSAREGYDPPVWKKRAQVKGLKESRITITGDEDQGLVSSEVIWTSPVI